MSHQGHLLNCLVGQTIKAIESNEMIVASSGDLELISRMVRLVLEDGAVVFMAHDSHQVKMVIEGIYPVDARAIEMVYSGDNDDLTVGELREKLRSAQAERGVMKKTSSFVSRITLQNLVNAVDACHSLLSDRVRQAMKNAKDELEK